MIKNKPPRIKAKVVLTEPETGTPLSVEGVADRVETPPLVVPELEAVALDEAVAELLAWAEAEAPPDG